MQTFTDALRSLYARLPVIRELRSSAAALERIRWTQWNILRQKAKEYEQRLLATERYADARNLNRHEFQVFSQFGEDGIIAEIFRRIGTASRTFVEIGIGDGLQNNTAYLLLQGWSGGWIDGNEESIAACQTRFRGQIAQSRLKLKHAFVDAANVTPLIDSLGVQGELDLFSLDIDRNTYYVWAALGHLRPRVAVIEYNAAIPAELDWKVEYAAERVWNRTMFFGASLKALERLGTELGYVLVGCSLGGANAFFVRNDLAGEHFEPPYTAEKHFEPFRPFLERRQGHPPSLGDD